MIELSLKEIILSENEEIILFCRDNLFLLKEIILSEDEEIILFLYG